MEQEEIIDPKYVKGFNHGYVLNEHNPKLLAKILKTPNESIYAKALNAGRKQQERDKVEERIKQVTQSMKDKSQERERD